MKNIYNVRTISNLVGYHMNVKYIKYVCLLIIILFIAYKRTFYQNVSSSEINASVLVDQPYKITIRELLSKDSLELLAEKNNISILKKEWKNLELEIPRILRIRQYKVSGEMFIKARIEDSYFGNLLIDLCQDIDLNKDFLRIKVTMLPNEIGVTNFEKVIDIANLDDKTKIVVQSKIEIEKSIPFFAKDFMQNKVDEFNQQDVDKFLNGLVEIITRKIEIK